MTDLPGSRPRPAWLNKMMAAKAAALEALTPDELAEVEADRETRRLRVEARRIAKIERAKTIFSMFFDGRTDVEIGQSVGLKSRGVRRFAQLRGFAISRSKLSVRRLVALSREHETHLRSLAERNGMTAAAALDLIISVALRDDGMLGRCILRNEEAVRGAVKHAFVTATYPPEPSTAPA
jgi:hypothetical protein